MLKLDSDIARQVKALCDHGETLVSIKEYAFAISKYYDALKLIPDPKREYAASTWVYCSIGETYWKQKDYNNAGLAFLKAVKCVGGEQNGLINLRLGQCLMECGETAHASEYLCQAYIIDGQKLFDGCDKKYFELIRHEVMGGPDDENYVEDDENEYYLIDEMLGDDDDEDDYIDDEDDDGDDEDPYESYDRRYYGDDGESRPRREYAGKHGRNDEELEEYDDDDGEYAEGSPVKRAISWLRGFFD